MQLFFLASLIPGITHVGIPGQKTPRPRPLLENQSLTERTPKAFLLRGPGPRSRQLRIFLLKLQRLSAQRRNSERKTWSRFLSSPFIISVLFFPTIRLNKRTQRDKGQKGTTQETSHSSCRRAGRPSCLWCYSLERLLCSAVFSSTLPFMLERDSRKVKTSTYAAGPEQ